MTSRNINVRFKSKCLKDLLARYDVEGWKSDSEWDAFYEDEDVFCNAVNQYNVQEVLDWFMNDLLFLMNSGNSFIDEYRNNRQLYIDDIIEVTYQVGDRKPFEYKRGVISDELLKQCFNNIKNQGSFRPMETEKYLGSLYLQQATAETEIALVRELKNENDPNAIFVEEVPHRYLGYFWHGATENLAPIFDSGQYLYKAKLDDAKKEVVIDFAKSDIGEDGWKKIEEGSPSFSEEELEAVKEAFDLWLGNLKEKYEGKKKPSSVDTIIKNGGEKAGIVKEWVKALYKADIAVVLSREGLLTSTSKTGNNLIIWDKGDESDEEYIRRIGNTISERIEHVDDMEISGKYFVVTTGKYGGFPDTYGNNPIKVAITESGGLVEWTVSAKTDYLIVDVDNKMKEEQFNPKQWANALKRMDKGGKIRVISIRDFETIAGLKG